MFISACIYEYMCVYWGGVDVTLLQLKTFKKNLALIFSGKKRTTNELFRVHFFGYTHY